MRNSVYVVIDCPATPLDGIEIEMRALPQPGHVLNINEEDRQVLEVKHVVVSEERYVGGGNKTHHSAEKVLVMLE